MQPRLRFDVELSSARTFFFGGFLGLDALGDRSMLGGIAFGFRFPGGSKD